MLNVDKLILSFEEIVGWPYQSPGTNNQYGIDCSGAFVRAYRIQNASIYHGSNRIIRVYCHRQIKVSNWPALALAAAVFKARSDLSRLSSIYKPGGQYYDPLLPYDYYHIGLITSLEPLTVINATTPKARKDVLCTRNNGESDASYQDRAVKALIKAGWTWWGLLNAVAYDDAPVPPVDPDPGPGDGFAKVFSPNGNPVRMRACPSTSCSLWWNVPNGSIVLLTGDNSAGWTSIKYDGRSGYMQSQFLNDIPTAPESPDPGPGDGFAKVFSPNGNPVRMRACPSTSCSLWWNVPNDTIVLLTGDNGVGWTGIRYNARSGYMQSQFLIPNDNA